VDEFAIEDVGTGQRIGITDASWAEWDQLGRLIFARDGQLYATHPTEPAGEAIMRADFNDQRPYERAAPGWANEW
jgi:hypothetical protein